MKMNINVKEILRDTNKCKRKETRITKYANNKVLASSVKFMFVFLSLVIDLIMTLSKC